jgi:hypothetical protein
MTFRVSEVESFRQWQQDEDYELDKLLSRLRGQEPASDAMLAGTAFHKALELASATSHDELEAFGYTFRFVGDFDLAIPAVREVRSHKTYVFGAIAITISGQLDCIDGRRVEDHKTTSRFDPDRYLDGYQWRFYLDIFGADVFRWNVFEIACVENEDPPGLVWEVYGSHRLEQYCYPELSKDCERLAGDLAYFAIQHMPERIKSRSTPGRASQAQVPGTLPLAA